MNRSGIILSFFVVLIAPLSLVAQHDDWKTTESSSQTAEEYYQQALAILQNDVHNALSNRLALEARNYIDKAIELDSTQSKYFRVKASTFNHTGEFDSAILFHDQALALDSTNYAAWMGKGVALENSGNYSFAEQCYFRALYGNSNESVHVNLGILYRKWGKDSLSIAAYDQAITHNPKSKDAYVNRGRVNLDIGNYADAILDFNRAIELDSTDKLAFNNRGFALQKLHQYEEAISDFHVALAIDLGESFNEKINTDAFSYNNMANAYFALGDSENACIYWEKALENGYVYNPEWKEKYGINDPEELIEKYCNK